MAHNIVFFDTSGNAVQRLTNADVDTLSNYILEYMASTGTFTGTISVGTSNPIGTFTDTALVGSAHPSPTSGDVNIVSQTFTLSQIRTATLSAQPDPPMYVGLDTSGSPTIVLQENLTSLNDLADEIITRMVATYGINSYFLGSTAPADGGVWSNKGTLTDTLTNLTVTNATANLWLKLNGGSATTNYKRPLKLSSGQLIQFTDAEIQLIVKIIEQRIVSTSIGTYVIQTSAPATGTWVNVGTISDVRENTQELNFDGAVFQTNFSAEVNYIGPLPDSSTYLNDQGTSPPSFPPNAPVYVGDASYTGSYTRDIEGPGYLGGLYIGGNYVTTYLLSYVGPGGSYQTQPAFPGSPQFNIEYSALYDRDFFGPDTNYVVTYTGATFESQAYLGTAYYGTWAPAPLRNLPDQAPPVSPPPAGPPAVPISAVAGLYQAGEYLGPTADGATYTGTVNYTGDYTGTYTGPRVSSTTSTISTVTLWKRIA